MSLAHGDHLLIKRNGHIIESGEEGYHEFVVTTPTPFSRVGHEGDENHPDAAAFSGGTSGVYYDITMQVVE